MKPTNSVSTESAVRADVIRISVDLKQTGVVTLLSGNIPVLPLNEDLRAAG